MGNFSWWQTKKNMHLLPEKRVALKKEIGNWRGARAVEWDGLENRYVRKGIVSSNLTLSV